MNDATIVAVVGGICTALPVLMGQLFAHMANIRKMKEDRAEAAKDIIALAQKQDVAIEKMEEVNIKTNGLTEKLAAAKLLEGEALGKVAAAVQTERDAALIAKGAAQRTEAKVDSLTDCIAKNGAIDTLDTTLNGMVSDGIITQVVADSILKRGKR